MLRWHTLLKSWLEETVSLVLNKDKTKAADESITEKKRSIILVSAYIIYMQVTNTYMTWVLQLTLVVPNLS